MKKEDLNTAHKNSNYRQNARVKRQINKNQQKNRLNKFNQLTTTKIERLLAVFYIMFGIIIHITCI